MPDILIPFVPFMSFITQSSLGVSFIALLVFVTVVWGIAYTLGRLDLVDVAWGGGFVVVTVTAFLWKYVEFPANISQPIAGLSPRLIVCALVVVWAVRLSTHIMRRWLRRKDEDVRYQNIRKKWQKYPALHSYFEIFLLQAVLLYIISLPVQVIAFIDPQPSIWLVLGVVVWLIGFFFEAVGDKQLETFASDTKNKGKLLTTGLWRFTRHPNYFGEVTQWWGIFIVGIPIAIHGFLWLLALIVGPLLITVLILRISGVPLTEQLMSQRDGWKPYARRTSIFLPLPPKKG